MINFGNEALQINEWDKIAQFIIEKCHEIQREEVDELPESQRGEWWWWSTWK
jgi:dUTPase